MIFWKVFHVNLMLSCVASSSIGTRIISLFSLLLRVNQLKFTHINSSFAQQNCATSAQQKTNIRNKHRKQQTQHKNKKLKFKFIPQKRKRKKHYLMISTWSIAPEKAKKSNTSLSVASGDSPVTSIVNPPLPLLMFSKLSSKLTKTTSYPSCFYYFQTWEDKKKQVGNISLENICTQL